MIENPIDSLQERYSLRNISAVELKCNFSWYSIYSAVQFVVLTILRFMPDAKPCRGPNRIGKELTLPKNELICPKNVRAYCLALNGIQLK